MGGKDVKQNGGGGFRLLCLRLLTFIVLFDELDLLRVKSLLQSHTFSTLKKYSYRFGFFTFSPTTSTDCQLQTDTNSKNTYLCSRRKIQGII